MKKNKRRIEVSAFLGKQEIIYNGEKTGEYEDSYSERVEYKANYSPGVGKTQAYLFGNIIDFDRTVILDKDFKISKNDLVYIDDVKYQVVGRPRKSINNIIIAIKEII